MLILLPVFLNTKKKKKEEEKKIIVKYCAFTVEMVIYFLGVQQCPTFLSSHYPFLSWK